MKIFNIMIQFINTHHFMLLLLIGLTTYVISLSIVPLVIAFVRTYDLLDVPNNRKMHEKTKKNKNINCVLYLTLFA